MQQKQNDLMNSIFHMQIKFYVLGFFTLSLSCAPSHQREPLEVLLLDFHIKDRLWVSMCHSSADADEETE